MTNSEPEYAIGTVHENVLAIDILADQFFDTDTAYGLRDEEYLRLKILTAMLPAL